MSDPLADREGKLLKRIAELEAENYDLKHEVKVLTRLRPYADHEWPHVLETMRMCWKAEAELADVENRNIVLDEAVRLHVERLAEALAELAALKEQLAVADEMDTALEWLDNGYVVRSTDKLERLDTAQRVYRELRAARAEEGSDHAPD